MNDVRNANCDIPLQRRSGSFRILPLGKVLFAERILQERVWKRLLRSGFERGACKMCHFNIEIIIVIISLGLK